MGKVGRFLVFAGRFYEACGGWGDFVASFSCKDAAVKYRDESFDWYEVVDTETGEVLHDPLKEILFRKF